MPLIPNYNVFGQQNPRVPYERYDPDTSIKVPAEWQKKPTYSTLSELQQKRRDKSISIASNFINTAVLTRDKPKLPEHFEARFPLKPESYSVPTKTRTDLLLERQCEAKNSSMALANNSGVFDIRTQRKIPKPLGYTPYPSASSTTHLKEAEHHVFRMQAGLLPINTPLNPDRELPENVKKTSAYTQSELRETRKQSMIANNEESAVKNSTKIPPAVEKSIRDAFAYEFRAPLGDEKTRTKLKDERRQEFVEYNQQTFIPKPKEVSKYRHSQTPFWEVGKPPRPTKTPIEETPVCFKVTENHPQRSVSSIPDQKPSEPATPEIASAQPNTVVHRAARKRWTTEIIDRGALGDAPRLFDSLHPAQVTVEDFKPLDHYSSFEIIRNKSLEAQKLARERKNPETMSRQTMDRSNLAAFRKRASTIRGVELPVGSGKPIPSVLKTGVFN
jgi:hypothetical protein